MFLSPSSSPSSFFSLLKSTPRLLPPEPATLGDSLALLWLSPCQWGVPAPYWTG